MFKMFHNGKEPNMRETEEWGNPDKIKEVRYYSAFLQKSAENFYPK